MCGPRVRTSSGSSTGSRRWRTSSGRHIYSRCRRRTLRSGSGRGSPRGRRFARSTRSRSKRGSRSRVADEITPEQLAEELRKLRIQDLVLSTVTTLVQLTYAKLQAGDLDESRLAIDAIAALLLPTLEGRVEADVLRDFRQVLANVRLA